ncbi:hypothetical protein Psi01_57370 [Planobispora siamensis]|uniref:Uncharacterized protein n=1 Tax=Planobispora siamensis TaxID=936338 RepID=A0A8J3SIV1_9ACTN|nr:hypothetical protein Psi01_57370 [Planobispora siamensis]
MENVNCNQIGSYSHDSRASTPSDLQIVPLMLTWSGPTQRQAPAEGQIKHTGKGQLACTWDDSLATLGSRMAP